MPLLVSNEQQASRPCGHGQRQEIEIHLGKSFY